MNPSLIIASIVVLIILSLVYKFAKKLFKLFVIITLVLIISTGVFAFFLISDITDLKDNFLEEESLIIITNEEQNLVAFQGNFKDVKSLETISLETLDHPQEELLEDNYKIITIAFETFDNIEEIEFEDSVMSKARILEILDYESEEELLSKNSDLDFEEVGDISLVDLKAFIIALMLKQSIDEEGLNFLIEEYKNENINIYPETITFKLINTIPEEIFEDELP